MVIADKAEDALKVIEGVLQFPRPTGKYALNKAYVDEQDLIKQLYTYCKSITDACVNAPKTLDERALIGAKAVSQEFPLGGMTIPTSGKRPTIANLNMYPEVYAGLQYKSSRLLPICESLYLQATNKHNKKEYMSSANACRIMFQLGRCGCLSNKTAQKAVLTALRDIMSKSAVALVGEEDAKEILECTVVESIKELENQSLQNEKDSNTVKGRKWTYMLHFNNDLKVIYASQGKIDLAVKAFVKSVGAMMQLRATDKVLMGEASEKKDSLTLNKLRRSKIDVKTVKDHAVKTIIHMLVWNKQLNDEEISIIQSVLDEAKGHLLDFKSEISSESQGEESKKNAVEKEIEEATDAITFIYRYGCVHCVDKENVTVNEELQEILESSHHSNRVNKSKDAISRVVWSALASASEFQSYQKHDTALRYFTFALQLAFHLFESSRVEIYSQILKFWVPAAFQASKENLKACGVTKDLGKTVADILQSGKLATAATINQLLEVVDKHCGDSDAIEA